MLRFSAVATAIARPPYSDNTQNNARDIVLQEAASSGTRPNRSRTSASSRPMLSSVVRSVSCAFSCTYDNGLGNLFLRHSLASDFSLFPDLTQPVLARNSSYGCNQRPPAVAGVDFIEAE